MYVQQEAASCANHILCGRPNGASSLLFGFVSRGWGHLCSVCAVWQCVFVHLFVRVCMHVCVSIVHPSPQLETTTSCVVAVDNGNMVRLPPALLAPTSASYNFTCLSTNTNSHTVMLVFSPRKVRRAGRHGYAFKRIPCWRRIWNLTQPVKVINCMNKFPFWKGSSS